MFSKGFQLLDFPQFNSLTTLGIENVYLSSNVVFPPNLTELEWTASRESSSSDSSEQLCKLETCRNLKYLLLAHTNFDTGESLTAFLRTISQLPHIMLIAFKFCRFKVVDLEAEIQPLEALKAVKIDLCYGEVRNAISRIFALGPNMKLFSFECMLTLTAVQDAYHFMSIVYRRNMLFKFSVLQRFSSALEGERNADMNDFTPPAPFQDIIGRLDLSFVTEAAMINCFIRNGWYARLQEFKAVRCDGVTDATLSLLAQCCPMLSKVYLTGCLNVSVQGLLPFVAHSDSRRARFLRVGVCGAGLKLADLCSLIDSHIANVLPPDRKIQYQLIHKRLPEEKLEEYFRLVVWECATQKQLMFHDYPSNALSNLIGLVVLA